MKTSELFAKKGRKRSAETKAEEAPSAEWGKRKENVGKAFQTI